MAMLPPLEIVLETGEENPERRRRNRTRVSCVNCYASKRKCDRQRPCNRCVKLSITGLCVYEISDPFLSTEVDEPTRLKSRIAELESVVRQLKRKPHPRWTAPGGQTHDPSLVKACHKSRRRARVESLRSASVETFFAAIAESGDEGATVNVKKESLFVPEFTPSEIGDPDDLLPDAHPSPRLASTPFDYGENSSSGTSLFCPPLTSFVQASGEDSRSLSPSKLRVLPACPTPPSADHTTFSNEHGNSESDIVRHHPLPLSPATLARDTDDTPNISVETPPNLSPYTTNPSRRPSLLKEEETCQCLNDTTFFDPLLHFAIALRTSREALQGVHPSTSHCNLFRRIVELEDHIFSAVPQGSESRPSQTCYSDNIEVDSALRPALSPVPVQIAADICATQSHVTPFSVHSLSLMWPPTSCGRNNPYFFSPIPSNELHNIAYPPGSPTPL